MSCDPCCEREVNKFTCHGAEQLECLLDKALKHNEFPGFNVGLFACDSTAWELNLGVKNEAGDPVTSDTVFQAGTVAMPFLAAYLAQKITEDLPLALLDKNFPQGFNTRISKYGDVRPSGPYTAFQNEIGNVMSHELVLNTMNPQILPHPHDLYIPHPYDTGIYEPFEETNPIWRPPWHYHTTHLIEVLNYVLPHHTATQIAETLGVNLTADLISFLTTKLGLAPTDGTYGKAAFQALPDIAEPLVREAGDWKAKYVYDGDLLISSAGLSINLKGLLRFLELYANMGKLDGEDVVDCKVLNETLKQRTSMIINPFPGEWDSTIGWKHLLSEQCRNKVVVMMTYLQSGGRALVAFWPEKRMGVAVLSNSMNAFPEAAAAYIINYFSTFSTKSATDEFKRVLCETEQYIKNKSPLNQLIERPRCTEIDIIGNWISEIGYLHIFLDGDQIKSQFHTEAVVYDPAIITTLGNNAYFFHYVDLAGIPRLFSMVFAHDGQFQGNMMNAYTYGGNVRFHRVRTDELDACWKVDPVNNW